MPSHVSYIRDKLNYHSILIQSRRDTLFTVSLVVDHLDQYQTEDP